MKKSLVLCLSAILVSMSLYSCKNMVFSPEGENIVDVEIPHTPMTIDLDNATDTLFIFGTTDFKYSVNTNGKSFSRINIYLDSTRVATSYDKTTFAGFKSEDYPSGAHKLRLELWARSGSGSLGDKAGAEFLVSTRAWDIFIDNRWLVDIFPKPDVAIGNGMPVISWTKYPYHNFYYYEVYKARLSSEGETPSDYRFVARITDPSVTSCKDSNFTLGITAYKVVLKAFKTEKHSAHQVFTDKPGVTVTTLDNQKIKVVWNKPKCYASFKSYRLFMQAADYYAADVYTVDFSSLSDTSYTDDRGFGRPYSYWVACFGNDTYYSAPASTGTGTQFFNGTIQSFQYVPELNSIYLNGNTRVDASSLKVVAESKNAFKISSAGRLVVTNSSSEDNYRPHSFTLADPLTFQSVSRKMYTDELMGFYSTNNVLLPSETGMCLYMGSKIVNNNYTWPNMAVVVKMNPYSLISVDSSSFTDISGVSSISRLSDEGEYILGVGPSMLNLKDGKLTKLYGTNLNGAPAVFTVSGKEYVRVNQGTAYIYRCSDNSLVRSFPVGERTIEFMIDPATGYLGIHNFSDFVIYDMTNGKLLKTINISGSLKYFLANSTLFSYNGYYMKVNYN